MMILSYLKNVGDGFNMAGFAGHSSATHKK